MNRSFSKIRHIQEANQRLEKRLMSEQVEQSGLTTTTGSTNTDQSFKNPFKDQSLLNKFVGKQFNTYAISDERKGKDGTYVLGNNSGTFEIEKAYFDDRKKNRVVFDLVGSYTATFDCNTPDYLGITTSTDYWSAAGAPSFLKELTKTFCTVGANKLYTQTVPKVDYPTP
jgi:hypothetical protein